MQIDHPMKGFDTNVLKYGHANTRGKGIWAFYNEDTQTLRVFSFQVQHLNIDDFERALNSLNPDGSIAQHE